MGPQACDAWKKEAEEAGERASAAGAECELAREQRDALEVQVKKLQEELERLHLGPDPQALPAFPGLEALSLSTLHSLQKRLRAHLEQESGEQNLYTRECVQEHVYLFEWM